MEQEYRIYGLLDPISYKLRYVGITKKSLIKRLAGHVNAAQKNKLNHRVCWIKGLLKQNLKPIIKEIDYFKSSAEEASKKEVYWIKYFSKRCNLTNMTAGGDGVKAYKMTEDTLLKIRKKVCQYSLDGVLMNTFKSITEAACFMNKPRQDGKICQVCKGKYGRNTFMGFVWRYEGDPFDKYSFLMDKTYILSEENSNRVRKKQMGKTNSNAKQILQFDLSKNFIKEWDTVNELLLFLRIKGSSWLVNAIKKQKVYKNCYWEYKNKDIVRSSEKSE